MKFHKFSLKLKKTQKHFQNNIQNAHVHVHVSCPYRQVKLFLYTKHETDDYTFKCERVAIINEAEI